jgi:hypothetical protein
MNNQIAIAARLLDFGIEIEKMTHEEMLKILSEKNQLFAANYAAQGELEKQLEQLEKEAKDLGEVSSLLEEWYDTI